MTDPLHTEPVEVTQADREAAAKCHEKSCYEIVRIQGSQCRNGYADGDYLVQAFARHRTAAEAASRQEVERLREAGNVLRDKLLGFVGAMAMYADCGPDVEAIKAWEAI